MKNILLAGVSIIALGATAANAADMPRRVVTKAPPVVYEPVYNWSGLYIGINGGGGWGDTNESGPFSVGSGHNISGGLIGGTIGYNWQFNQLVFGVEGDIDWARIRGTGFCGAGAFTCTTDGRWIGTARARLGYAMGRFMPYVTAGAAAVGVRNTIAGIGSATDTKGGWTAGVGLEAALVGNWTGKIEYLYVDAGRGASVAGSEADFRANLVRVGLNYRF